MFVEVETLESSCKNTRKETKFQTLLYNKQYLIGTLTDIHERFNEIS